MKLFTIFQTENNEWDTINLAVVVAPDEKTARIMNPGTGEPMTEQDWLDNKEDSPSWCSSPEHVIVKYIGEAADSMKQGVIVADR